jgi:hypothetical protein
MKKLSALLFLLLFSVQVFAGNPVVFVNGTVTDKSNHETLAGVEVRVKGTSIVTYTDFDGHFFLPDLPAGSYELEFRYLTYASTKTVAGNCDQCISIAVEMEAR